MVYIFTLFGFLIGFGIGLGTANVLLRNKTKDEILKDQSIRWKYGSLIWIFGFVGAWLGLIIHNNIYL